MADSASIQPQSRAAAGERAFARLIGRFNDLAAALGGARRSGSEAQARLRAMRILKLLYDPKSGPKFKDFDAAHREAGGFGDIVPGKGAGWGGLNVAQIADVLVGLRPAPAPAFRSAL